MKYLQGMVLVVLLTFIIGFWLENTLPDYGYALGTGIALSFIIGFFTTRWE